MVGKRKLATVGVGAKSGKKKTAPIEAMGSHCDSSVEVDGAALSQRQREAIFDEIPEELVMLLAELTRKQFYEDEAERMAEAKRLCSAAAHQKAS